MKIKEAVAQLGYDETPDESLCIARIKEGRIVQATLAECGERDLDLLGDVFIATGAFRKGSIQAKAGRTQENLVRVMDLPLDFDLTDFFGIGAEAKAPAERSQCIAQWRSSVSDNELEAGLRGLHEDAAEVLSLCHVPVSAWVRTGYGLLALSRLASSDQSSIREAISLHAYLVGRINAVAGSKLIDPQVKDAGSRLIRLPGSFNMKGPTPRPVTMLESSGDDFLFLDNYDIAVSPKSPPRRLIPDHATELSRDDERTIVLALNGVWDEGSRHGVALGVGGMLAKANVPQEQAERIIETVATENGDREYRDRLKAVQTSYQRIRSGLEVSGFMRLRELIPDDVLQFIDSKLETVRPQVLGVMDVSDMRERSARSERRAFAECPEEVFYGWFDGYRQIMAPTTEACDAFHLGTALVFAGSLVGRRVNVHLGTRLFPNLYLTLVGETGRSRKDTAMSRGQSFFGERLATSSTDLHMTSYSLLRGATSGEGLIDYLSDNPTTILYLSELSTMVRRARRQGTLTLMPTLIELWDAPSQVHLPRAGKDAVKCVENPFLSILAATTPQTLADDMTSADIESGFANRVLWFFGQAKAPISRPPKPDEARCARLYSEFLRAIGQYPYGTELQKSAHAEQMWDAWYLGSYDLRHQSEDEARMAQRMGANIHRIALIYAASEASPVIGEGHLAAATALVEWSFACASEQSRRWGWSEEARVAIAVKDALWAGPADKLTIARSVGERIAPSLLLRTIEALVKTGQLLVCSPGVFALPEGG